MRIYKLPRLAFSSPVCILLKRALHSNFSKTCEVFPTKSFPSPLCSLFRAYATGKNKRFEPDPIIAEKTKKILADIERIGPKIYFADKGVHMNMDKLTDEIKILEASVPAKSVEESWTEKTQFRLLEAFRFFKGNVYEIQQREFPLTRLTTILDQLMILGKLIGNLDSPEREKIDFAIQKFGHNWERVSSAVGDKSPLVCFSLHSLRNSAYDDYRQCHRKWLRSDSERIVDIIAKHGENDWDLIAEKFGKKFKKDQIKYYYNSRLKERPPTLPWTEKEDFRLKAIKRNKDFCSDFCIQRDFYPHRTMEEIDARWKKINPDLKLGPWSKREIDDLMGLVERVGVDWKVISWHLRSRTPAECQTKWFETKYPHFESNFILT